jgi:hypothetical protein
MHQPRAAWPENEWSAARHAIPSELYADERRVRRKRPWQVLGVWFVRLFILPHTLLGLCLLVVMPASVVWAAFGTDHVARILEVRTTTGSKGSVHCNATYAYDGPDGYRHGVASVPRETCTGGETIVVRSIGRPPLFYEAPIVGGGNVWIMIAGIWAFGLFWVGVLSAFVHQLYVVPWRQRRLYRTGTPVRGTVIDKRVGKGRSSTYHLRYAYRTDDGQSFEEEMSTSREDYQSAAPGAPVTVLIDPGKPRRSIIYEYGPYHCG